MLPSERRRRPRRRPLDRVFGQTLQSDGDHRLCPRRAQTLHYTRFSSLRMRNGYTCILWGKRRLVCKQREERRGCRRRGIGCYIRPSAVIPFRNLVSFTLERKWACNGSWTTLKRTATRKRVKGKSLELLILQRQIRRDARPHRRGRLWLGTAGQ